MTRSSRRSRAGLLELALALAILPGAAFYFGVERELTAFLPAAIALVALAAKSSERILIGCGLAMLLFVILGAASIGLFFIPSTVALFAGISRSHPPADTAARP